MYCRHFFMSCITCHTVQQWVISRCFLLKKIMWIKLHIFFIRFCKLQPSLCFKCVFIMAVQNQFSIACNSHTSHQHPELTYKSVQQDDRATLDRPLDLLLARTNNHSRWYLWRSRYVVLRISPKDHSLGQAVRCRRVINAPVLCCWVSRPPLAVCVSLIQALSAADKVIRLVLLQACWQWIQAGIEEVKGCLENL